MSESQDLKDKKIRSFEELVVWQRSHEFLVRLYGVADELPNSERFILRAQLLRATSSVAANIAEGFGRFSYRENIQFLRMARGSLAESKNHLLVARELGYIKADCYNKLAQEIKTIGLLINKTIQVTQQQISKEAQKRPKS